MSSLKLHGVALALAGALVAGPAAASDDALAGKVYEQGAAAQDGGDHAKAARLFAEADALSPNAVALEAALGAALLAENAGLAMELSARAEERGASGALSAMVTEARGRFQRRAGRLRVECDGCSAKIDGEPAHLGSARWLTAGYHLVEFNVDGERTRRLVKVEANRTLRVTPSDRRGAAAEESARGAEEEGAATPGIAGAAPAMEAASDGSDRGFKGISQAWFWTGVGLTALAGGLTIASGVDTMDKHRTFTAEPTDEAMRAGLEADGRTQVLGGVTAVLGVGTAVLGIFAVRWKTPAAAVTGSVAAAPGGGSVAVSGRF